MKRILILIMITALLLSGCLVAGDPSIDSIATGNEATYGKTDAETEAPTEPPKVEAQAKEEYDRILNTELTESAKELDIELIDQFPELPAGCEAVSLTMAINCYGYDLSKTDIVDDYLIYGSSLVDSYVGDPHVWLNGAGIYPPGLVNTTWNFVEDTGARLFPIDTTGLSLDELCLFVQAGYPAVVWSTYYDAYPIPQDGAEVRDGIVYQWYRNEHCVVLYGYDIDDGTLTIADPVRGSVTLSFSTLENIYDTMGQFSMVMLDTTNYDFPPDWTPVRYTYGEDDEDTDEGDDD